MGVRVIRSPVLEVVTTKSEKQPVGLSNISNLLGDSKGILILTRGT